MIYCLIGQSASGKSSVESLLERARGIPRIISFTTRSRREGETDGVSYHFIDTPTFHELADRGFFTETAEYNGWNYGLSLEGIDYINKDYIVVVTVHGYEELVKAVGFNVVAIHIKVDERERMIRQLKRGDDVDEVIRRINTDRVDFAGVEEICDCVVHNDDLDTTVKRVYSIINANAK